MKLERKPKTARDETWLLILGVQVLFGFAFQETPLKTKIEQLLTEARVIITGGQAFQNRPGPAC
jgi:hypothetical protein